MDVEFPCVGVRTNPVFIWAHTTPLVNYFLRGSPKTQKQPFFSSFLENLRLFWTFRDEFRDLYAKKHPGVVAMHKQEGEVCQKS